MPNTNYLDQMNVKANEQDTVGTDYDLRDKDLNAADAKTSVASTDYIVLKGTDGSYHTIDKSSFTEAVRGVLGGILNNMTSKGTAVKGVGVIDNSNDFGLTTPSDLASVLGVMKGIKRWKTDVNSVIQTDIPANAGSFGNGVIIVASNHHDTGDATTCAIFLLRIGYSGNNVQTTKVAELTGTGSVSSNLTISIVDGYIALDGYRRYLTIECRL